ncbi:hypothetical protein AAV99_03430 [Aurantiacibacter marinus]|uniref:Phytanoyl-CoA dioxygenase n=2 Tax=Aurantiacibacter marinus TaxID=874156 RepID=A0A0H0XQJ5_9SPHN|nr:hypothetical protein AAV99_03430 [Aurantiacibacter marinus]
MSLLPRLGDPAYLDGHLIAVKVLRDLDRFDWYDSVFLRRFEAAKAFLALAAPEKLAYFVDGFSILKPSPDFTPAVIDDLLDDAGHAAVKMEMAGIAHDKLEKHEISSFGRYVVHDHAPFIDLQRKLLPLASRLAGRELETGYNFLSRYGNAGRCDPHMDQPISMYTLDYCISQTVDWPIHFSQIVEWPSAAGGPQSGADAIADPQIRFEPIALRPNKAVFFCGSSQWHYRDAMPDNGNCDLLFFHYFPAGCSMLVNPSGWIEHFDLPELQPLFDLLDGRLSQAR